MRWHDIIEGNRRLRAYRHSCPTWQERSVIAGIEHLRRSENRYSSTVCIRSTLLHRQDRIIGPILFIGPNDVLVDMNPRDHLYTSSSSSNTNRLVVRHGLFRGIRFFLVMDFTRPPSSEKSRGSSGEGVGFSSGSLPLVRSHASIHIGRGRPFSK